MPSAVVGVGERTPENFGFGATRTLFLSASSTTLIFKVFSESANHSRLQPADTAAVVVGDEATAKGAVYADVAEGGKSAGKDRRVAKVGRSK